MTLILAFLSREFVVLASDRKVTWSRRGKLIKSEDTENKAISICGHFLMGYTVFAKLGGVHTDQWVVERLSGITDASEGFSILRAEAESAIRAISQPLKYKGHAFVAVGYMRSESPTPHYEPVGLEISNATEENNLASGVLGMISVFVVLDWSGLRNFYCGP